VIKKGDTVKLHYTGKLEDGKVFDEGFIEFEVGAKQVIQGIDEEVVGMEKGEKKEIVVSPQKGFGERREELKTSFSKSVLHGKEVKEGDVINVRTQAGEIVQCLVGEITDDEVILDFNHPLAGKTLRFELEVMEVS